MVEPKVVVLPAAADTTPLIAGKLHATYRPNGGARGTTGILALLPSSDVLNHPLLDPLAQRGYSVLGVDSRFENYGAALRAEPLLYDIKAGVDFLREQGARKVVLLAVSLGGPLMTLYQSHAERPGGVANASGDTLTLSGAALSPADALILHAAQRGPAPYLTDLLDPSVVDEHDAFTTDPSLDMFDSRNGPPYAHEWVLRYRAAQLERNRRISVWANQMLHRVRQEDPDGDMAFIVHRTAADLRFLDLAIDPSSRAAGTLWGDPRLVNRWGNFHGRHTTLRSWLSYWSLAHSHIDGHRHITATSCPVLLITMGADEAVFSPDGEGYRRAVPDERLTHAEIEGATHRMVGQRKQMSQVEEAIDAWIRERVP